MRVKIGEILFLGDGSVFELESPIAGLRSPAIRNGDGNRFCRDGGYVSGQFYGHRTITIKGFFISDNCVIGNQLRKILIELLKIRYSLPIIITLDDGSEYYAEGYIQDIKCPISSLRVNEYQITLLCTDPIIYESEDGEPKEYSENLGAETTIINFGGADIYPTIIVEGIVDGIELKNATTGQTMQIEVETESAANRVVVDMQKREITLNGIRINENRTPSSRWWYLAPGENTIQTSVGNSGATAMIQYRKGFIGI